MTIFSRTRGVAKVAANEEIDSDEGWFSHSKSMLRSTLNIRNGTHHKSKIEEGDNPCLKELRKQAKIEARRVASVAKKKWIKHVVDKISVMKLNPKEA